MCLLIFSNLNISATSGPIVTKFYLNHHWGVGKAVLGFGLDRIGTLVSTATDSSHSVIMGGGVAQWLGHRMSDQGVPGSNPSRCTFRCGLEQVTFTLLSTVEPRKWWTDDRL